MQNRFELFSDHPLFAEANAALIAALEHAARHSYSNACRTYNSEA
jgi:hypothetical protein